MIPTVSYHIEDLATLPRETEPSRLKRVLQSVSKLDVLQRGNTKE